MGRYLVLLKKFHRYPKGNEIRELLVCLFLLFPFRGDKNSKFAGHQWLRSVLLSYLGDRSGGP
jgi:hypothetical protein